MASFDEMLAQGKRQFDTLYKGARPGNSAAAPVAPVGASPVIRQLNERFGSDWRYEIASRQREGDEAIVLCKLTIKGGTVKTQFGRARLSGGPVSGSAGGLRFRLEAPAADEDDAFRRATEDALAKCLELV
jgi:hypothetical protein